jgi:hypothetical protein
MGYILLFLAAVTAGTGVFLVNEEATLSYRIGTALVPVAIAFGLAALTKAVVTITSPDFEQE